MCKKLLFLVVVAGLLSSSALAGYYEDPNLFLHFEFDEGAGTTITSTVPGASVSGTMENGVAAWVNVAGSLAEPNGPILKEDLGTGLDLDDVANTTFQIWCGNDPNLNYGNKDVMDASLTFWMRMNEADKHASYCRLMWRNNHWDMYFYARSDEWDNGVVFHKRGTDGSAIRMFESARIPFTTAVWGQWNSWVYKYDHVENVRRAYVNGISCGTTWGNAYDPNLPLYGGGDNLKMFNRYNTTQDRCPAGQWDDILFFNRALENHEYVRLPGWGCNLKQAFKPSPEDGTGNLSVIGQELTWMAGAGATSHKAFYGKVFEDVNSAVAGAAPAGVTEVDRALSSELIALSTLDLDSDYYWRVDEGQSGGGWEKGIVWDFSTTNNALVENFETYTSDADLWKVWLDSWPSHGSGPANNSGSTVRIEGTIVNNGSGAMKLLYDNCNDWGYGTDHYSETEASTSAMLSDGSSIVGGNFAYQGCKALDFYYKGDAGNAAQQMYIGFTDGTNTAIKVLKEYDRYGVPTSTPDTGAVQDPDWTLWQVDLVNNMNSVNTSAITKVYLGTGVRGQTSGNPSGTVGTVYYDDLGLFLPRCYAQYVDTDFNGDCVTNESDVGTMTAEWLNTAATVNMPAPVAPTVGPIMHYTFDACDLTNSGSTGSVHDFNDGGNSDNYSFIAGKVGAKALHLDGGSDNPMFVNDNNCINVNDITFAFWYKWEGVSDRVIRKFRTWNTSGKGICFTPFTSSGNGRMGFNLGSGSLNRGPQVRFCFDPDAAYAEWGHYVLSMSRADVDGNDMITGAIYVDGSDIMQDQYYTAYRTELIDGTGGMNAATYDWKDDDSDLELGDNKHKGSLDDLRIYDYALTYAEARSVYGATGADSVVRGPTGQYGGEAVTNLSDSGAAVDQTIDFKDFAELGKEWLEEDLWPFAGAAE